MLNKMIPAVMCVSLLCLAGNAFAVETTWSGIVGDADDWVDGANWDNGVPVDNTFEVVIDSGTAIPHYLPDGHGNIIIGNVGTASSVLANTVTVSGAGTLKVDHEWGVNIGVWASDTGRLIQTGGSVEIAANLGMGGGAGSASNTAYGEYLMSGGSLTANKITMAGEGNGYMEIGGGSNVSVPGPANGETASMLLGYYRQANSTLAILGSGSTIVVDSFSTMSNNSDDKDFTDLNQRTLRFGFDAGGTSMIDVVGDTFSAWRVGGVNAYLKGTLDLVDLGDAVPGTYTVMRADSIGLGPLQLAGSVDTEMWSYELVGTGVRDDGELDELVVTYGTELPWDGTANDWYSDHWGAGALPTIGTHMTIDHVDGLSVVTVAEDFTSANNGPAGSFALGTNYNASLIIDPAVTLEVTGPGMVGEFGTLNVNGTLSAGSLTADDGATLNVNGTLSAATLTMEPGSTLTGSGTIAAAGEVMLAGIVAPGNSLGVLSLDVSAGAELADSAAYRCEIGADDAPIANDAIDVTAGDLALGGTLELVATSKLRGPDESGEWFGEQTRSIITAEGDSSVLYNFATPPTPLPEDFGAAEWGEGHIGRGVFLTRENNGGENDAPGVSYSVGDTQVHLFQAIDGDTNGNAILDTADIFSILGAGSFLKPGEWDWTEGDFDGDQDVDTTDIFAILATGKWGNFDPYYPEPGKASAAKGDAVVDLIVNAATGEVSVDTNGAEITGYMISSDSGALTGEAATQFTLSEQTADQIADMLPLGKAFAGVHDLGSVLEGDGSDLTLTYTLSGQAGVFKGNVQVVPEPGTLIMLLSGGLGLLLLAHRRRMK